MSETIGFEGCAGSAVVLINLQDHDGPPGGRIQPATEWDLWRAGYIAIKRVEDLAEMAAESEQPDLVDEGQGVQDFIAEGPPLPTGKLQGGVG